MATILITGVNRGIGLALARHLAERGDRIIGTSRVPCPELECLGVRVEVGVDVAEDASVAALARRLGDERIHVLVHNAGVGLEEHLDSLDLDQVRLQIEVNALGPLRVTVALLKNLQAGSKVIILTSRYGSLSRRNSGAGYGYRISKAAANMVGRTLAGDLKPRGILVALVQPGFVRTDMTRGAGDVEPDEAARNIALRIDELRPEESGTLTGPLGEPLSW